MRPQCGPVAFHLPPRLSQRRPWGSYQARALLRALCAHGTEIQYPKADCASGTADAVRPALTIFPYSRVRSARRRAAPTGQDESGAAARAVADRSTVTDDWAWEVVAVPPWHMCSAGYDAKGRKQQMWRGPVSIHTQLCIKDFGSF